VDSQDEPGEVPRKEVSLAECIERLSRDLSPEVLDPNRLDERVLGTLGRGGPDPLAMVGLG